MQNISFFDQIPFQCKCNDQVNGAYGASVCVCGILRKREDKKTAERETEEGGETETVNQKINRE